MKTLIISDIHNKVDLAEALIAHIKADAVIMLGDYFDSLDFIGYDEVTGRALFSPDNPSMARYTAQWLKCSIQNKNRYHCWGNHDISYYPNNSDNWCPGHSVEKMKEINSVLSIDDWHRLKFLYRLYFENKPSYYLSHAGMHPNIFCHPVKLLEPYILECSQLALKDLRSGTLDSIYLRQGSRMGQSGPGGIVWLDWNDFSPIEGVSQIVGHTNGQDVRINHGVNSFNYCLDTHMKHYGLWEDGDFNVYENPLRIKKK